MDNNLPIYLDNASTTPVHPEVLKSMLPYFSDFFGNASSNHIYGTNANLAINNAREKVSELIKCKPSEIIFTSGSTESINMAIKGYLQANPEIGNHIITVKTEHKAVLSTCEYLETLGYNVTYLDVDQNGIISIKDLENAITPQTSLISVMYVNNELGVIQPIKDIGAIAKENTITFFCDATQAIGKIKVDINQDTIGMLCFSSHKLNGPKGVGVLYKRESLKLTPLIHGGGQENGLRSGTYNTPLIVGLGKACEILLTGIDDYILELLDKRKQWERYFEDQNIGIINFKNVPRAPHILSITLNNFEAEEFLMMKSKEFVASTGSACNTAIIEPSHVLKSLNLKSSKNIIRVSL